jgi:hypothetical protein
MNVSQGAPRGFEIRQGNCIRWSHHMVGSESITTAASAGAACKVNMAPNSSAGKLINENSRTPGAGEAMQRPSWVNRVVLTACRSLPVYPPQPDIFGVARHVSKVPTTDIGSLYSITSSARATSAAGISSPSAFEVLRFITNSNFIGCSTGMSAGFAPLMIFAT